MLKFLLAVTVILLGISGGYQQTFTGEDLAPVKDISLCASSSSIYLAYTPPDSKEITLVQLDSQLNEVCTLSIDDMTSPCIKWYNDAVYLAGIKGEAVVIRVFTDNLELVREFVTPVEEPVDVYILPCEEGIILSYVHRFLEDDLLHQDVFVKKFDFSFTELGSARLTSWDYWEESCLAVVGGNIVVAYSYYPLSAFMSRYVMVALLDSDLNHIAETTYPKDLSISDETPLGRNVVEPDLCVVNSQIILLFRITDQNFSATNLTWEGEVIVVPGNIHAVVLTNDLLVDREVYLTEDYREHFGPCAAYEGEKIYFVQSVKDGSTTTIDVVSAPTLEELKPILEPPQSGVSIYWIAGLGVGIVFLIVLVLFVRRRKRSASRKSRKRTKNKKGG
ncbi:MAG: hypothetical protein HXS41_07060 [Theionarchaea archaeon]|nr:hypothetical protein [Theionarchaea archaeon]MBU7020802.1 hypothetical protein [Theionarchaea archaeon]MBU7034802.1 hypothetical protein [Theionarchaea archaeon]MBU7040285.1 hypothetical protein [Theionarchaea archaeon]